MQKTFIIVISAVIVVSLGIYGWMYYSARTQQERAEQQLIEQQKDNQSSMGQGEQQQDNTGMDQDMMENKQADTLTESSKEVIDTSISLSPEQLPGGPSDVTITLNGMQGISAFNIVLETPEGVSIEAYNNDIIPSSGSVEGYSQILNYISEDKTMAKISYVAIELPDEELAKQITFSLNVNNTSGTSESLIINTDKSQMVGPAKTIYNIQ